MTKLCGSATAPSYPPPKDYYGNIKNGLDLIKHFEGCELYAYKCPAGVWTIGYGHTKGVEPGMQITPTRRRRYATRRISRVRRLCK